MLFYLARAVSARALFMTATLSLVARRITAGAVLREFTEIHPQSDAIGILDRRGGSQDWNDEVLRVCESEVRGFTFGFV